MVKRPDNAIAEVDVFMKDGRYAFNQHLLVKDLRKFWREHKHEISFICFDIGLTGYFWNEEIGWKQWSRYHYNPNNSQTSIRWNVMSDKYGIFVNVKALNDGELSEGRIL